MSSFNIYTFCMGREKYLGNLIDSIVDSMGSEEAELVINHKIVFQGYNPSDTIINYIEAMGCEFEVWDKNVGIAEGMNRVLPTLSSDIIIKMDDDCKILTKNFFMHVAEIARLKPGCVFSPYPIGLINNPGGPQKLLHEVIYSENTDTYYTLRYTNHIGGFARISPGFTRDWKFQADLINGISGNEDGQHSEMCRQKGIPMFYLENAIAVEHQESTLGQHQRYKDYFKDGRF